MLPEGFRRLPGIAPRIGGKFRGGLLRLGKQRLDGLVFCKRLRLLLQDQVTPHTPLRKVLDALGIFGAVGMGIEMTRAVVADLLQQFHEEKRRLDVVRSKPEILVVAARILIVEVNMEELAGIPRLRHGMREVQPGHVLVGHFGIHAHHVGAIQRADESQHGAHRGKVDVAARLVGFRLQRKAQVIPLIHRIFAQEIQRLPHPGQGVHGVLRGVGFGPFAASPENIRRGPALHAKVHGAHRLVDGVRPDRRIVGGKSPVPESRVREQVRSSHRHLQAPLVESLFEGAHDLVPFLGRRVDGHQVVVMEIDSVGAHIGQQVNDFDGRERGADRFSERVPAHVSDGPETERELVFRFRTIRIGHNYRSGGNYIKRSKICGF